MRTSGIRRAIIGIAASLAIVAGGANARAQDPGGAPPPNPPVAMPTPAPAEPASPAPEEQVPRRWYGWQTLIEDGLAGGQVALAYGYNVLPLYISGVLVYGVAPPITHILRGHGSKAGLSFGLRAGGPIFTGAIGYLIGAGFPKGSSPHDPKDVGFSVGICVGALLAAGVDAAFIAHEDIPLWERESARLKWTPTLQIAHGGGTIGVGGVF